MSENARALVSRSANAPTLPSPDEWDTLSKMAGALVQSRLLPQEVDTWQKAAVIIQKGHELGVPPMAALSGIAVIKGKPTCSAELLRALIQRDHGDNAIRFTVTTAETCTATYKRRGWTTPEAHTYTMEDAKRAGITTTPTWTKYPADMLRARCTSAIARMAFADSIGGMYTAEEMGAEVEIIDGEEVIVTGNASRTTAIATPAAPTPIRPSIATAATAEPSVAEMRAEITTLAAAKLDMDLKAAGWSALTTHLHDHVNAHIYVPESKEDMTEGWYVQVLGTLRTMADPAPDAAATDDTLSASAVPAISDDDLAF